MIRYKISPVAALAAYIVFLTAALSSAQYYPYYYPPAPVYRAPPYASPTAAALGPWKWNFNIGGGPTPVVGGTRNQLTNGWNFIFGGGYNFTPRLGFVLEFMDTGLGVTNTTLQQNQANDGDAEVWSITLNPIWRYRIAGPVGGYIIGGGGFYQRETRFFQTALFQDSFGNVFQGNVTNRDFDNTGGVNIGTGLTCNIGWGTKFFVEVRYHYVFTSGYATQILPVTIGLRW
jgi:hypothetical protein